MKKWQWRILFFVLLVVGIGVSVLFFPEDEPMTNISYEQVEVSVRKIDVRRVGTVKYMHENRYDVSLMYEGKTYVWTSSTDPHLNIGMTYTFYLNDGNMYRTEQELQRMDAVSRAPWQVRVGAMVAFIAMVGFFTTFAKFNTPKKNKTS